MILVQCADFGALFVAKLLNKWAIMVY